jgi:crotonobetainyl-CoA:carnitine CoA-transferase CaiB-like acyl-CoA transferase
MLLYSGVTKRSPQRIGNRSVRFAPQGVYPCAGADQWCAISIQNDDQWRALVQLIGNPAWGSESRFATLAERLRSHDEIDTHIREWTQTQTAPELESRLKQIGIPAERMRRIQDVMDSDDRSEVYRNMPERRLGSMCMTWLPFSFSSGPWPAPISAPSLGEHSSDVLRQWLNLGDEEIQILDTKHVLI